MSDSDSRLLERAQTAEAIANTAKAALAPLKNEVRQIKETFGIRKRGNGAYQVGYDVLVKAIGLEGYMELRAIGDQHWNVSGDVGEKPRVRIRAPEQAEEAA